MTLKKLLEEYKPQKSRLNNSTMEIWENPTQSEMHDAKKEYGDLRWTAILNKKKVLIWDNKITHARVLFNYDIDMYNYSKNILCGYIENNQTEIEMTPATRRKEYFDRDFNWIKKYIPNFEKALTDLKAAVGRTNLDIQ